MNVFLVKLGSLRTIESVIENITKKRLERRYSGYFGSYSLLRPCRGSRISSLRIEENRDPMWSQEDPIYERYKYPKYRQYRFIITDRLGHLNLNELSERGIHCRAISGDIEDVPIRYST